MYLDTIFFRKFLESSMFIVPEVLLILSVCFASWELDSLFYVGFEWEVITATVTTKDFFSDFFIFLIVYIMTAFGGYLFFWCTMFLFKSHLI